MPSRRWLRGRSVSPVGHEWLVSVGSEYAAPELEEMVRREATATDQPSFFADPGMWNYAWDRRRSANTTCTALCNTWTRRRTAAPRPLGARSLVS